MFKTILKDNFEIAEYIETVSVSLIDLRLVEEYFFGCFAILKEVNIETLHVSDENCHLINTKKKKKYQMLPLETIPPLVVENRIVVDGHHRMNVLKHFGIKTAEVYEIYHK